MQQILVNFCQFLYRVIPVVIFPTKRWPESTFRCFVDWKLFSTLLKNNPVFYLVIMQSFLNFLRIPQIRFALRIRGMSRKF